MRSLPPSPPGQGLPGLEVKDCTVEASVAGDLPPTSLGARPVLLWE